MEKIEVRKKYVYLEVMRIVASFFIIFNHTATDGFFLFAKQEVGSIKFWGYMFISIFCKFAVPLFFAISGVLMLKKAETVKKIWLHRIPRFIVILIIISVIYYLQGIKWDFSRFEIKEFIEKVYMGNIKNHLWFIYAYIAFLISLPLLRSLVSKLKEKDYYYIIGLVIIFNAIIPIVEYLIWKGKVSINQNIKVTWLFSNIVFYPCLGYFLQNEFKKYNNKNSIIFLRIVNIIGIIISCYMTYYRFLETGALKESNAQAFFNNFSFINCIWIFITIKYVFENAKMPNWINKLIYSVGSCTFGIYLIHLLILNNSHMKKFLVMLQQDAHINNMVSVFIVCLCVMVISYIITFLLKKVIHIAAVFGRNILERIKKKEDNEN